jgi:hypothetical protein
VSKKYQIFISSTFSDLQEERQLALKAILDLDHIPSGMEAFPAIDMEQFEYIKKVIDECDYYLLIIGARYGSTDTNGVSFTEREFDYAISKNKTVIALLHNDVQSLPKRNFDADPALESRLNTFRDKVKSGRMVRLWNNRDQLVSAMMQAIIKAIATYPANGWIRGDEVASEDVVKRYMQLRSEYDDLYNKYKEASTRNLAKLSDLAKLEELFEIRYSGLIKGDRRYDNVKVAWRDILKIVGPNLYSPRSAAIISSDIIDYISQLYPALAYTNVNNMDTNTIKIHLHALGILDIQAAEAAGGGVQEFVSLTESGKAELIRAMAVRTETPPPGMSPPVVEGARVSPATEGRTLPASVLKSDDGEDPFGAFTEWDSDADRKAYAGL